MILLLVSSSAGAVSSLASCSHLFETRDIGSPVDLRGKSNFIRKKELVDHVEKMLERVSEFSSIRSLAEKKGIRVWLFGGTASSFLHYVKMDLASRKGLLHLQRNRFDYEFSHIFRSSQDVDIVIDAPPEVAIEFQNLIVEKFPYFLGSKKNQWEVRTLRHRMGTPGSVGYKEAVLDDQDFEFQNTDSNSIGMIEVTRTHGEAVVRDLKHWNELQSIFLQDTLKNRITYFRSNKHFTTSRAMNGENPEILSIIRLLVKAFQFDLDFSSGFPGRSKKQLAEIKKVIEQFNPKEVKNPVALRRIQETAKKLIIHAVNIESAMEQLDQLGLRQKLIELGYASKINDTSWWLSREPLRSTPVGQVPEGLNAADFPTAKELGLGIVAHETIDISAFEAITRAYTGEPNALISRRDRVGETAIYGDGFYVRKGRLGSKGAGLTIRFQVDPEARLGIDFRQTDVKDWFVFTNKKALKIIHESLEFEWEDLIALIESGKEIKIDPSDLALIEKFKRRFTSSKINEQIDLLLNSSNDQDLDKLVQILSVFQSSSLNKLFSNETLHSVVRNLYYKIPKMSSNQSQETIQKYLRVIGPLVGIFDHFSVIPRGNYVSQLEELLKTSHFSFEVRKTIAYEILLNAVQLEKYLQIKENFNSNEFQEILFEIKKWNQSPEKRKRDFVHELNLKWNQAVISEEINQTLKPLIDVGFFGIQDKNYSGLSILQVASYYDRTEVLDWLIRSPEFDFNQQDSLGDNEVEQLRLHGKNDWANEIQRRRPEVRSRVIQLKERLEHQKTPEYPHGIPVIDFVRIEPTSFLMGGDKKGVLTTITHPFEILSVDVIQKMFNELAALIERRLKGKYLVLSKNSSFYYRSDSSPAYGMSFNTVQLWIEGINELSLMEDNTVQDVLKKWLPGHEKGARYQLPTEAQWEVVTRLGGRAGGSYAHGKNSHNLYEYAVYDQLTPSIISPVGIKKPVFYRGQPIYDLHGLIWHWVSDWHDASFRGGVDPLGPSSGTVKVLRGGSFGSSAVGVSSDIRFYGFPELENLFAGFRLVRL